MPVIYKQRDNKCAYIHVTILPAGGMPDKPDSKIIFFNALKEWFKLVDMEADHVGLGAKTAKLRQITARCSAQKTTEKNQASNAC